MKLIEVRATINLPGLPVGTTAVVDPLSPYVRDQLRAGYVIRTGRKVDQPTQEGTS